MAVATAMLKQMTYKLLYEDIRTLKKEGHVCYAIKGYGINPHVVWCDQKECTGKKQYEEKYNDECSCTIF